MPTETQKSAGGTGQDALSSTSEIDSAASSPCLRNAATAAPGEKVASLESADESVRAYDEDEIVHTVPCSCYGWSQQRVRLCLCGSASSAIVLVVRLLLDWYSGTTYVIHSFIVYFDMMLIHLFTCSPWLSASGEVVTYLAVLAFYITKHRIFELMETVAIAALCSIHLIRSRNKHLDHEHALQEELTALKHSVRSARVLPDIECGGPPDAADVSTASKHASTESTQSSIAPPPPPYSLAPAKARRRWREDFYDHFLDGAAGVMYTSFLGLILDDLIALGTGKYKKC
ncbi:unnamed protein product [Pelagomonas calceolata]|uniref:Uncharacterized protein n=1 Tax=Pelagomonas calceolata TaxID=35677 RepID=A0A8J2SPU7_9STRA|nr:unnamed protein product [Pelagomonas calceolata]